MRLVCEDRSESPLSVLFGATRPQDGRGVREFCFTSKEPPDSFTAATLSHRVTASPAAHEASNLSTSSIGRPFWTVTRVCSSEFQHVWVHGRSL